MKQKEHTNLIWQHFWGISKVYGAQSIPDKKGGYDGNGYMVTWLPRENASQIVFLRPLLRARNFSPRPRGMWKPGAWTGDMERDSVESGGFAEEVEDGLVMVITWRIVPVSGLITMVSKAIPPKSPFFRFGKLY